MRVFSVLAAAALVAISTVAPSAQAPTPAAGPAITFTKDVAPILQRSCQNCHRPDSNAPMSLDHLSRMRGHMRDPSKRRPPRDSCRRGISSATSGSRSSRTIRALTDKEIATIAAWVDQGAPKGDMAHMPAPRTFENDDVWHIGKPDLIVEIPQPHVVPASGPDVWIDYIADSGLTEDRYVQAVETKPGRGARTVMHHLLTYLIQDVRRE